MHIQSQKVIERLAIELKKCHQTLINQQNKTKIPSEINVSMLYSRKKEHRQLSFASRNDGSPTTPTSPPRISIGFADKKFDIGCSSRKYPRRRCITKAMPNYPTPSLKKDEPTNDPLLLPTAVDLKLRRNHSSKMQNGVQKQKHPSHMFTPPVLPSSYSNYHKYHQPHSYSTSAKRVFNPPLTTAIHSSANAHRNANSDHRWLSSKYASGASTIFADNVETNDDMFNMTRVSSGETTSGSESDESSVTFENSITTELSFENSEDDDKINWQISLKDEEDIIEDTINLHSDMESIIEIEEGDAETENEHEVMQGKEESNGNKRTEDGNYTDTRRISLVESESNLSDGNMTMTTLCSDSGIEIGIGDGKYMDNADFFCTILDIPKYFPEVDLNHGQNLVRSISKDTYNPYLKIVTSNRKMRKERKSHGNSKKNQLPKKMKRKKVNKKSKVLW